MAGTPEPGWGLVGETVVIPARLVEEARRRGRWETWLLGRASRQLAEKLRRGRS